MDSPYIKQTVCKVLNIFQHEKYLVVYVLNMHQFTVATNGVAKRLDRLNIHEAPGPGGLNARLLKRCSYEIASILAFIIKKSLAQGDEHIPDDSQQAKFPPVLKWRKCDSANFSPVEHTYMHLLQNLGS